MTKPNLFLSILLAAAGFTAGCDAPHSDAAERVTELAAARAPEQPREEFIIVGPDDEPLSICDIVPPDAVDLDGLPTECDDTPREYAIHVPEAGHGPSDASIEPQATKCEDWTYQEFRAFDSPCNSCKFKPNMPGWKRAYQSRWCNACGTCWEWTVEKVYCNDC